MVHLYVSYSDYLCREDAYGDFGNSNDFVMAIRSLRSYLEDVILIRKIGYCEEHSSPNINPTKSFPQILPRIVHIESPCPLYPMESASRLSRRSRNPRIHQREKADLQLERKTQFVPQCHGSKSTK
jgi:hypothetical protein